MTIRKAKTSDGAAILTLMRELIDEHCRLDKYYKPWSAYRGLPGYIREAIHDPNHLLLVACDQESVIGYFLTSIEPAPFYSAEKKIGVIADTAVSKKYRRRGVLKQLFAEAQKWFRRKKVRYLELSVDARNHAAVSAWRKLNFKDYKLRLKKSL